MDLTDEELSELHSILEYRALYGDDEIVYGEGREAHLTRVLLGKVHDEAKERQLWWAR